MAHDECQPFPASAVGNNSNIALVSRWESLVRSRVIAANVSHSGQRRKPAGRPATLFGEEAFLRQHDDDDDDVLRRWMIRRQQRRRREWEGKEKLVTIFLRLERPAPFKTRKKKQEREMLAMQSPTAECLGEKKIRKILQNVWYPKR